MTVKQAKAITVEGSGLQASGILAGSFLYSLPQLLRSVLTVGSRKNLCGLSVTLADEAGNALREHQRLAGTGAGDNQHGPTDVLDGLKLAIIEGDLRGAAHQRALCGSEPQAAILKNA
jgi:hypothetical protein